MSGFSEIWNVLDWSILTDALISIIPALFCITFHELSHGFVAYRLGDNTAKSKGRLTLNPIKHIDVLGLICMAFMGFGWAKPVPVNMNNFKNPKSGMAIVALAGPVSNIVLAVVVLIISFFFVPATDTGLIWNIWLILQRFTILSIGLAIFNIIPIPPLDGSKVLFSFLREDTYYNLMRYERYGMILLILLIWSGVLGTPLSQATYFIYTHLYDAIAVIFRLLPV